MKMKRKRECIELNAGSTGTSGETMGGLQSMAGTEAINMTDAESNMPESESDQSNQDYGDAEGNSVLCGDQSCDLSTNTCRLRELAQAVLRVLLPPVTWVELSLFVMVLKTVMEVNAVLE